MNANLEEPMKRTGLTGRIGRIVAIGAFAAYLLAGANGAQASTMNLTLQDAPNIFSDAIDVSYDAAAQTLTARGFAEHLKNGDGQPVAIVNGTFEISAKITASGEVVSGALTVSGAVPSLGVDQGPLLVGKLVSVGGDAGGVSEFQFVTNGGAFSFQFGPAINVIVGQSGFPGNFAKDFTNGAVGVAGIGW
jgi:hypothetical protein